ncbi:SpoIIE family protein phosphatase [Streptomyces sp. NPDC052109]|uniref:SpoIIE family protein phosphatase n=1 Tax=Streptomyces sp. NPDC052109 TaxID=3155527 RepID=UPI0034130DF7
MTGPIRAGEPVAAVGKTAAWWKALPVALIICDDSGRIMQWARDAPELLGYTAHEAMGRDIAGFLHSDSDPMARTVQDSVASGRSVTGVFPVRHKNGRTVEVEVWACPIAAQVGPGWNVLVLAAEADAARQAREGGALLDGLFARSPVGMAVFDTELRFQEINRALEAMNGMPASAYVGRRLPELFPGVNSEQMEAAMRRVLITGDPVVNFRIVGRTPADPDHDRSWSSFYFRLENAVGKSLGISASIVDITAPGKDELETTGHQRLQLLNEAALRVGTTLDVRRTAQELADLAVPRLADTATVDVLAVLTDDADLMISLTGGATLCRQGKASSPGLPSADTLAGVGGTLRFPAAAPYTQAVVDRRPFLLTHLDARDAAAAAPCTSTPERLRSLGVESMMMVPLIARGLVLGMATFLRGGDRPAFDAADLTLAGDLAAHAAVCIDNARLYHREHDTALTLQRSMLPRRVEPPSGIEIAHRYLPASDVNEVGGDWYDVTALAPGRGALAVGDVMGHGIQAAAVMGQMRTAARALAHLDMAPEQLLRNLDHALLELDSPVLATCLYGVCDVTARRCWFSRAGHPPPVLVTPDGSARLLDLPPGIPLGIGGLAYTTTEITLDPGSILVLYTDGLVESRTTDLDRGLDELVHLLTGTHPDLDQLCGTLIDRLAPPPAEDDITVLAARIGVPTP